ncbi:MAG: YIP1 family protein [Oscillospiraceae bacterium]
MTIIKNTPNTVQYEGDYSMFCAKCGTPNDDNATVCSGCGLQITKMQAQPQNNPMQPTQPTQPQANPQNQPQNTQMQPMQPQNNQMQPMQPQNTQMQPMQPAYNQQNYQQNGQSNDFFKKLFNYFLNGCKKPVETCETLARSNDMKMAFTLLAVQSVASLLAYIFALTSSVIRYGSVIGLEDNKITQSIYNLTSPFIYSMLVTCFLLLFVSVVYKEKTTFSQMLSVAATAAIPTAILTLTSMLVVFILSFMDGAFAGTISSFFSLTAKIVSWLFINSALKSVTRLSEEKRMFTLIFAIAAAHICKELFAICF